MIIVKRLLLLVPLFLFLVPSGAASAATAGPGWALESVPTPTHFSQAENTACTELEAGVSGAPVPFCTRYEVSATNAGSEPTDGGAGGSPIVITDTLPQGVTVASVVLFVVSTGNGINSENGGHIGGNTRFIEYCPTTVPLRCTYTHVLAPDERLLMRVYVTVNGGVREGTSLSNKAEVSGGGAARVSTESTNEVSSTPAPFGTSNFSFYKDALDGSEETQAGGHPYELTTTIDLDDELRNNPEESLGKEKGLPQGVEAVKDVVVDLPLGFVGSTLAAPECTEAQMDSESHCPPDTVVGHITTEPSGLVTTINSPIWNLVPEQGHPAEFGYIDISKGAHVVGYASVVPTPAGYVLRFVSSDIPEILISRIVVSFYGDPAAKDDTGAAPQVPFFTNPTACSGSAQVATIWMDSWHNPARFQPGSGGLVPTDLDEPQWVKATSESPPVIGCNALQFTPEIGSQPTTHEADKPTGLEFEQRLPQSEVFGTNATPALKDTTISFPAGMTVDPSAADGLGTCSNAQIGWTGPTPFDFTEAKPDGAGGCPENSKIGTLELETPLIPGKLYGEVFLAAQDENPFHSTFATYIVVNDPATGVVLKLAGELKSGGAGLALGQLTAVFDETPQLPFSALKVHFFGGPRAELATPPNCGIYTTNSELEPWSAPDSGLAATPFDDYTIDESCATGFAPSFAALTTNVQAGEYTPFEGSFSREDDDQELAGLTMNLPPGLLADVASVPECGAAEIAAEAADAPTGGCPAGTQVGTVTAEAGPGPNPLAVPGKIFFTGPYNGGPYGLAVVVSANPGPFHFGNVVVRQSLRINPLTAAVTDVSDQFPTFLDPVAPNGQTSGIPIKLRRVDFDIDRSGFTFNPTNCGKLGVSGAITSTQGASANLAVPFQVTACERLKFAPKFAVSTSGKTSKARGASLTAKVSYGGGGGRAGISSFPQGTYADIAKVKVELPKALPSRLTTLQKACTDKQFEANPAACPSASKIGYATVKTPILAGTLSGPAIFVSHGGEAFPSLEVVLQGDGVTIELVGATFISHSGITSTTFKTVPDSPFTSFELTLPEGKYSALAANGNLCKQKLAMPNEFVAQNGATLNQDTKVSVTGCPKAKALTRAQKLAAALRACRKRAKGRRAACEARARREFGARTAKGKKK